MSNGLANQFSLYWQNRKQPFLPPHSRSLQDYAGLSVNLHLSSQAFNACLIELNCPYGLCKLCRQEQFLLPAEQTEKQSGRASQHLPYAGSLCQRCFLQSINLQSRVQIQTASSASSGISLLLLLWSLWLLACLHGRPALPTEIALQSYQFCLRCSWTIALTFLRCDFLVGNIRKQ